MFSTSRFIRWLWVGAQLVSSIGMIIMTKNILAKGVSPLVVTTEILLVGGVTLVLLLISRKEKIRCWEIKQVLPIGIIGGCLAFWLGFIGLSMTQASNYSFLTRFATLFTCVLSYFFLKEKWSNNKTLVIILIMLGSFLMSASGNFSKLGLGDLIVIGSSLFYSMSYVMAAKVMKQVSALATSTYRTLSGGLVLFIIMLISNQKIWLDTRILITGVFLALAVLSAHKIIRVANASYMVLVTAIIPVATTLIMTVFFGEHLTSIQIVGAGTILLGSFLTEIKTS